jgi:hypothetical protein
MLLAILAVLALQQVGQNGIVWIESSYLPGERLDFAISRSDLENSPKWFELRDDPPLAPRQAVHVAEVRLATLVPDSNAWRLASVSMRPSLVTDAWVYVIQFDAPPAGPLGGSQLSQSLRIVVLMNGVAIEPHRRAWPEQH